MQSNVNSVVAPDITLHVIVAISTVTYFIEQSSPAPEDACCVMHAFVSQVSAIHDLGPEHILLYNVRCVEKRASMSQRALSAEADSQHPAISVQMLKLVQQLQKLPAGYLTRGGQQVS